MRSLTPVIILSLAVVTLLLSLLGDGSIREYRSIAAGLKEQRAENEAARQHNLTVKRNIYQLQTDSRALEKAARNELGMARADERIFVFGER